MSHFAINNECPGENAPKAPSTTVSNPLPVSNSGAQEGEAPVPLKISWHAEPAHNVAILDLTGQAGGHVISPPISTESIANAGQSRRQKYKNL
jgi:hypothetical protein